MKTNFWTVSKICALGVIYNDILAHGSREFLERCRAKEKTVSLYPQHEIQVYLISNLYTNLLSIVLISNQRSFVNSQKYQ